MNKLQVSNEYSVVFYTIQFLKCDTGISGLHSYLAIVLCLRSLQTSHEIMRVVNLQITDPHTIPYDTHAIHLRQHQTT